jgi:hypothetical protein
MQLLASVTIQQGYGELKLAGGSEKLMEDFNYKLSRVGSRR